MGNKNVKVEGLRELDAALGELGKSAARGVLRRTGIKALEPFDKRWRELAPRGEGNLADSGGIGTRLTKRQASLNRRAQRQNGRDFVEVHAGPNNPAAVPQEFGTVDHGPQSFARPAWDQTKNQVLEIVKTESWAQVKKTADRQARRAARLAVK